MVLGNCYIFIRWKRVDFPAEREEDFLKRNCRITHNVCVDEVAEWEKDTAFLSSAHRSPDAESLCVTSSRNSEVETLRYGQDHRNFVRAVFRGLASAQVGTAV